MEFTITINAFNISSIPRYLNQEADLLANVASRLIPSEGILTDAFSVELLFRPSIPDNIANWRVFNDDQQLIDFLTFKDTFKDAILDEMTHNEDLHNFAVIHKPCSIQESLDQVSALPRSVIKLEKFYD